MKPLFNLEEIQWGKVVIGAAVAAGAIAVIAYCPPLTKFVGEALHGAADALGTAGAWLSTKITDLVSAIQNNAPLAIGSAAAAGGLAGMTSSRYEADQAREKAPTVEKQSYTMAEDMRRMQALMIARMQATGHIPATEAAR